MKHITLLLKPTEECNIRCKYCYHADTNYIKGRMSIEMFEEIIRKLSASYDHITLTFHGGEPLLMGYDFYVKAFEIINKYKKNVKQWRTSIQTNGILLNEKYCELFEKNGFSPSISFDGPGDLNQLRENTDQLTQKIIDLRNKGYKISLLGVITKRNISGLSEYYEFCKKYGCSLKLNPVFESGGAKDDNDYLINPEDYVTAIKKLFSIWVQDDSADFMFDPLSSLTYMALSNRHAPICEYCGCLTKWLAISCDGSIYPCSRSYPEEYYLGNIKDYDDFSQVLEHDNFRNLMRGAIQRRFHCKDNCRFYNICQGGCNNDSILNGDLTKPAGFKCAAFKTIIPYIAEYLHYHKNEVRNTQVLEMLRRFGDGKYNDK